MLVVDVGIVIILILLVCVSCTLSELVSVFLFVSLLFCFFFLFVYPPLFLFLCLFLEFINGVCGLIWMCCGGIVAYYVECTNVVKKWFGSACDNRDYQERRGWGFKPFSENVTSVMFCVMTSVV